MCLTVPRAGWQEPSQTFCRCPGAGAVGWHLPASAEPFPALAELKHAEVLHPTRHQAGSAGALRMSHVWGFRADVAERKV